MAAPRDVDDLYALPPEDFTAARDELAASLRSAGDRDAAANVKKLRRPTVAGWALNQLVRRERDRVRQLIEAGEALRTAQRKAASGAKDSGFREATERRRELVHALTRTGIDILAEAGRGTTGAEGEIGRTLEAASVDPGAAEELLAGRLTRPLVADAGFDSAAAFEVVPDVDDEDPSSSDAEREALEVAVRNAERQSAEAEAEARRAAMRAEHLERQAEDVTRRASEARIEAGRHERASAEARERLERARAELERG